MSAPFKVGQRLKVRETYKRAGTTLLKAGAEVTIERVSTTGAVIISGHSGWFSPSRFEVLA